MFWVCVTTIFFSAQSLTKLTEFRGCFFSPFFYFMKAVKTLSDTCYKLYFYGHSATKFGADVPIFMRDSYRKGGFYSSRLSHSQGFELPLNVIGLLFSL